MFLSHQNLDGICKVLGFIHDKETVQHILNVIGRENWTSDVLCECDYQILTEEQKELYDTLGCVVSDEEFDEVIDNLIINSEIKEQLIQQGVTPYLYENVDYLNSIREGKVICEGIDIEQIKKSLYYED